MGFWGSIKKAVGDVGDVVKKAAPIAAFIPGVGPIAAAAAGGLGGLAGQLNDEDGFQLGDGLKEGALSAGASYGAGKLGGLLKGAGGIRKALSVKDLASSAGGLKGLAGKAWDFTKSNPELLLGAAGMYTNAKAAGQASDLRNEAMNMARSRHEDSAPFRQMALEQLSRMGGGSGSGAGGGSPVDLEGLFDTGGAYDRPVRRAISVGGARPPQSRPPRTGPISRPAMAGAR